MLGTIVLALTIIQADPATLSAERLDSGYCDTTMWQNPRTGEWATWPFGSPLPCEPIACVPTYCETFDQRRDGALVCLDSDDTFPAGHWAIAEGPDDHDAQVIVEY